MIFPIKVTQPSYSKPAVTVLLIMANVLVFLHEFWLEMVDPYSLNHFMTLYSLRPAYFHFSNIFKTISADQPRLPRVSPPPHGQMSRLDGLPLSNSHFTGLSAMYLRIL